MYCENKLPTEFLFMDCRVYFWGFLEALGLVFLVFAALETGLNIDGFLVVQRISSWAGAGGNNVEFDACKQLNRRWLVAESMTDGC